MSRASLTMESVLWDYMVLGKPAKGNTWKLLLAVADAVAGDVVESCRRRECPFCGRRFRSASALARHLSRTGWVTQPVLGVSEPFSRFIYPRNPCAYHLSECLKYVVDAYLTLRESVRKAGGHYVLTLPNGRRRWFSSVGRLSKFIRENKDLVKEVLRCGGSTTASSSLPG